MARRLTSCDVAQAACLRVPGAACSRFRGGAGSLRRRSFSLRHPRWPGPRAGCPGHPQTGSLRYAASQYGNRFLFQGRDRDPDTGLYNFRHRTYSPTLGRFLQTDPIGERGGWTLYSFVENSPTQIADPLGLASKKKSPSLLPETSYDNCFLNCKSLATSAMLGTLSQAADNNMAGLITGAAFTLGGIVVGAFIKPVGIAISGAGIIISIVQVNDVFNDSAAAKLEARRQYLRCLNDCKRKFPSQQCAEAATEFWKDFPIKL